MFNYSGVFSRAQAREHESVVFFYCPVTKLKAIVAIHSTVLGPSLGGCRIKNYSSEEEALEDVTRLSEGMSYKNSIAGLNLGGGKACIIADSHLDEGRDELFTQFGKYLNTLSGTYYTAEDMGTRVSDIQTIKQVSNYCVGFAEEAGGSGDPSPWTAKGVFESLKTVVEQKLNKKVSEITVAIEGIGKVGYGLAQQLKDHGAKLIVTDVNQANLDQAKNELGAKLVALNEIHKVECDVFAPCAIGQTINKKTIKSLTCKVILGAANNQISDSSMWSEITGRGIIYCPDFVVNAGGVISVGAELNQGGWKREWVHNKIMQIPHTLVKILDNAEKLSQFPEETAIQLAKKRIKERTIL